MRQKALPSFVPARLWAAVPVAGRIYRDLGHETLPTHAFR